MSGSGDILVDRRFLYAQDCIAEKNFEGACELLEDITKLAPRWAGGWLTLAQTYQNMGFREKALAAYDHADTLDGTKTLGAALRADALRGTTPDALPENYVKALFDEYAPRFETHLREGLGYRTPQALLAMLQDHLGKQKRPLHFSDAVDLGCGTGLMGECLHGFCDDLIGVDLSPAILAKAQEKKIYSVCIVGEAAVFLQRCAPASLDLIAAADVLVYIGDLDRLMQFAARSLRAAGIFMFSVQAGTALDYELGQDLRYRHSESYLRKLAIKYSCNLNLQNSVLRKEAGHDVPGLLCVMQKV